jgi:hypothetical protein
MHAPHSLLDWTFFLAPYSSRTRVFNPDLTLASKEEYTVVFPLKSHAPSPRITTLSRVPGLSGTATPTYSSVSSDLWDIAWFYFPFPCFFLDSRTDSKSVLHLKYAGRMQMGM